MSESTAGGVEAGSITFDLCREVMHRGVLVSEEEILRAMRWGHAQGWADGGRERCGLGGVFQGSGALRRQEVVVLICGGNPSPAVAELVAPEAPAASTQAGSAKSRRRPLRSMSVPGGRALRVWLRSARPRFRGRARAAAPQADASATKSGIARDHAGQRNARCQHVVADLTKRGIVPHDDRQRQRGFHRAHQFPQGELQPKITGKRQHRARGIRDLGANAAGSAKPRVP